MRVSVKVEDISPRQWEYLVTEVPVDGRTFYDAVPRLCVEFAQTQDSPVRLHIEMDAAEYALVMIRLERIENEAPIPPDRVRRDCAFCHRERSAKDDNHADDCPYWTVGPGSQ